jgi:uncharacterized membrane protein YeaQ/YmgE (transglycosylase-associated protein family)
MRIVFMNIVARIVAAVVGWAIYTLISEPGSQIDKFEAILFAIVMAAVAPQLLAFIKTKK